MVKQPIKMVIVMIMHYFHSVLEHGLPPSLNLNHLFNASTHSREAWKYGTRHKGTFQLCQSLVSVLYFYENQAQGGSLISYFDEKYILKLFPLSSCQHVSIIPENCMLPIFQKWTFCKGLYGLNDGPSIWGKQHEKHVFKPVDSNYNQMTAYAECSPNQTKKLYLSNLSIKPSTKLCRFRKSDGRFCI